MRRVCKWLAILSALFSVKAFVLALWGGSLLMALQGVLGAFGLSSGADAPPPYPLGAWVYPLYLAGLALGLMALRHPLWAGIAMIPLGSCTALWGGPIAQIYGFYMILAGAALAALTVLERSNGYRRPEHAGAGSQRAADR